MHGSVSSQLQYGGMVEFILLTRCSLQKDHYTGYTNFIVPQGTGVPVDQSPRVRWLRAGG